VNDPPAMSRGPVARPTEGRAGALSYILLATAIAGAVGYAIQLLAPVVLPDSGSYLAFSVYWSTVYVLVAALAGVQQEISRATTPGTTPADGSTLRAFALRIATAAAVVAVVVTLVVAPSAFPDDIVGSAIWIVVAVVGYVATAVLAGVLYGLSLWRAAALLVVVDALLRALLVMLALALQAPHTLLTAAVSVPFGGAFLLVWFFVRRRVVGQFRLDVGARRLVVNTVGTVTAAAATGLIVTGIPVVLRTTMPGVDAAIVASLILTITISRAPLIVPIMALQSYLIVDFRSSDRPLGRRLALYLSALAAVTAVGSILAACFGETLLALFPGGRYAVPGWVAAGIVASAGAVAALCVTGPALLSRSRHDWYVGGWVIAALSTVLLLLLPAGPYERVVVALSAAPLLGIAVHVMGLRRPSRGSTAPAR